MEQKDKHLKVTAIKNGTVLDHIPAESLFKVIDILNLSKRSNQITIGSNLDSRSMGKKGIIKISEHFFEDEEIGEIALIAPNATINIIRDYEVVEKKIISIPESFVGIFRCMNPMCVTNHQDIPTKFTTVRERDEVLLLCHYCEKTTDTRNLKIVSKK
ncbi:MAG TPA: aspartate carbamoyltransferase regulatory subunit [Bacteroidales bacterium]|jgi:aspartate carbamoyltransferase regulatory subunit|nr:aspartate carbamoyltransferase regulatory subunit [Bacteroidales bacterium]HPH53357.1 aspartate carbamoyltransferase regulatory subunit [Bacteroidales bacterium]HPY21707.1 aspartate carbamoyltransferase regulatory subunit [Bacteroidales bacterium]HQA92919.1 aspartate carbamoyltransferase regulatory subunit [Bacteroidales bacterium]HQN24639.1 aspartate carbamoyltransferase regulatory subunit [Bacteroidales bacterium]